MREQGQHVRVVVRRLWRHSLRQPALAYVIPTVMPLGLVVFISQLYGAMAANPGYPVDDLLDWMGPGVVFLAATMGGGFTATVLAVDAKGGFLDRLRLLPISSASVVAACLLFEAFRIVPVAVVLLAAGAALGLDLPGLGGLVLVVTLAAAWAATWNAAFVVLALRTRNVQLAQTLLPLFLPFFLASTIMVPRVLLPGYVQATTSVNPLDRFTVAARPLFLSAGVDFAAVAVALFLAAVLVGALGMVAHRELARVVAD